ncbi:nuclease-related domain-containing protein [Marinobacter sp. W-8]|uniref:nuclease-related domain-containing protein n=1 Tax=Marinobacter sp. W-8 TaxID=3369658 RepID=UPI0037CBD8E2
MSSTNALDQSRCHLIKSFTLTSEVRSTLIEYITVSRYGVFVVETKNVKGRSLGKQRLVVG